MVSIMKIMMIIALLVIGVSAKTVEQCKRTTCETKCHDSKSFGCSDCLLRCAFPGSDSKIDQRALCIKNCDVGCGPSQDCYQRCIKRCPSPLI
ncbi:unnamed protein product [Arabidopsis lyrata]|uniref:Thionin-like protein n=1 Tax=Arabidopsis lyrata subsp. lyrata TaxID=81972 RepID=D7KB03_ARALL|nr:uncharacterized protein LOC9330706 [Arabidopsis lyrata subsp. lyrata]EFH68212.1 hypothetical protein ARALYDRAFT_892810 [Arabidopsis lyrata subsp. lyrata]CAH8256710.1 unnamed protein product [Arabidopsis lyrata]|eukprot:XP_002891953.1 uncharacterized protein LOC9330706 [Arabidopsis lyrata subsp. lyrata]